MPRMGWLAYGPPLAAIVPEHFVQWWVFMIVALAGPVAYICRSLLIFLLGLKALAKVEPNQVPAVITAITGHPAKGRRADQSGTVDT